MTSLPATFEDATAAGYVANCLLFAELGRGADAGYFELLRRAENGRDPVRNRRWAAENLALWMRRNGFDASESSRSCERCGGTGYYGPLSVNDGRCFECNA